MDTFQRSKEIANEIHQALRGLSGSVSSRRFQLLKLPWLLSSCLITQHLKQYPQERLHQALKSVFSDILITLEQENPEYAQLLRQRYWEGSSVKEIVHSRPLWGVSERQFYRMQEQALELFALLFSEMEEVCNRASYQVDQANEQGSTGPNQPTLSLSRPEIMILELSSQGFTSGEIGILLGYSRKYIEKMLAEIRNKIGAKNTTHAVALAFRQGLIPLNK